MANHSEDEFDLLPNDFEGVDLDSIPALSQPPFQTAPSLPQAPDHGGDSTPSSDDYGFDEVNQTFFREVDDILERYQAAAQGGVATSRTTNANIQTAPIGDPSCSTGAVTTHEARTPSKREAQENESWFTPRKKACHSDSDAQCTQPLGTPNVEKERRLKFLRSGVRKVLEDFEDELTCPICFDILACAHLGNPCGHTFCGQCGKDWISRNSRRPTCAICRGKLAPHVPAIPNIAVDNLVEKHIQALAATGADDWTATGSKYRDWIARKERSKATITKTSHPPRMDLTIIVDLLDDL